MKICSILFLVGILATISMMVFAAEKTINTYDLTYLYKLDRSKLQEARRAWDEGHFVVTIQGIVNQKDPNLYIFFVGDSDENETNGQRDHFWFDKMTAKGDWMGDWEVNNIKNLNSLIDTFKEDIKGLVVYDGNVPSTSNVASTIAGVDHLAAIRYDKDPKSLYYYLTEDPKGPKMQVKVWLVNEDGSSKFTGKGIIPDVNVPSTGTAKCDPYIWAKIKYLDNGKCNPHVLGYYIDAFWIGNSGGRLSNNTLTNHDYVIANKGFLFDLSPWDNEPATDDRNQPLGADVNTLKAILLSAYEQNKGKMIQAAGFLPWDKKYTMHAGGINDDVPGEWRYSEILSCYNAYMDADALGFSGMANGSVFSKFKLKEKYPQKKPTIDDLKTMGLILPDGSVKKTTYVTFYVGDYDAAAWLYQRMPDIWEDKLRGEFPLGWAFNPNLSERFAYGMDYFRKTATPNDYFVTGDVGAGYINPGHLVEPRLYSGLPSGVQAWKEHCQKWMNIFDLSIVGFVIDGFAPAMNEELFDMYAEIAPDGIGGQKLPAHDGVYKNKMPYIKMESDVYRATEDAKNQSKKMGEVAPEFYMFRNILWTPTFQKEFMDTMKSELKGNVEFLSPYHFFLLMKYFHQNGQEVTLVDDTNLFDHRKGLTVLDHSPIINGSDMRDIFRGNFGTLESQVVLFADEYTDPAVHWVEWKTKEPVDISSVLLQAKGDGPRRLRYTAGFRLGARKNSSDHWTVLVETPLDCPSNNEESIFNFSKVNDMQYFRAELLQDPGSEEPGRGPRILEIKGFTENH